MNLFSPNVNPAVNVLPLLNFLNPNDPKHSQSNQKKKMKDILNLIFKRDIEFYTKLRNILTTNFYNYYKEITEKISSMIYTKLTNKSSSFFIEK